MVLHPDEYLGVRGILIAVIILLVTIVVGSVFLARRHKLETAAMTSVDRLWRQSTALLVMVGFVTEGMFSVVLAITVYSAAVDAQAKSLQAAKTYCLANNAFFDRESALWDGVLGTSSVKRTPEQMAKVQNLLATTFAHVPC